MNALKLKSSSFLGLAILLNSCGEGGDSVDYSSDSDLPETFKTLEIEWGEGGGMEYRSESIMLYPDSGRWELNDEGHIKSVLFQISKEEINGIYDWLRKNRFDRIESEDRGHVDDRGGIHIYATVDGERYGAGESGGTFIKDEYLENWGNVSDSIHRFAMSKVNAQYQHRTVFFDPSMMDTTYYLYFDLEGEIFYNQPEYEPAFDLVSKGHEVLLLSGPCSFYYALSRKDSLDYYKNPSQYLWQREWIAIDSGTQVIRVFRTDSDSLKVVQD